MLSSSAHKAFDALTWDVGVAVDTDAGCKTLGALSAPGASSFPQSWLDLASALSTDFSSENSSSALKHALFGGGGGMYTLLPSRNFPSLPRKKSEERKEEGRGREGMKPTQAPC